MKSGKDLSSEWKTFINNGDQACFYSIYEHYHDYLTYISFKKNITIQKTEDGINDLFLYIYENREKLTHIKSHHNYIVSSFIRKLFKKQHFSAEESEDLTDLANEIIYPSVESQHIKLQHNESLSSFLKLCIDKLSNTQAKIVYQKFYLNLSYEEISVINNITVKTAYNTVYNAVEKLKMMIEKSPSATQFLITAIISMLILFFFKKNMGNL